MAVAAKKQKPALNPQMLRWAREWRGRTLEEAAHRVGKTPEDIAEWEATPGGPTVRQARTLADFYNRQFLEFFRSTPPPIREPRLVTDFRLHRDAPNPKETRELKIIQAWAEAQRANALDLFEEIGEAPPSLPAELFSTPDSPSEEAAERARRVLKFPFIEQTKLPASKRDELPAIIRKKLEGLGILTLKHSGLADFHARGICIFATPLPVIIFGNESPAAQAFTLAHELAHVSLKESGISGKRSKDAAAIERWCDQFAAAFLMPRSEVAALLGPPRRPQLEEMTDEWLNGIASHFRVSAHAMLIRLVNLDYIKASFYWGVKKPLFDAHEANYKSFGRPKYYGSRYRSSLGNLYTGLVLEAWNSGRITNHSAAEYMGIKNFEHLFDIRSHFAGS
ncbi:ImmA/IrrE family metallo-endopeptidase [Bradyrhizobium sp. 44]|uniref:XRE family transcriptional regulator n=1 Tax=Bradyrhizobium sp. 44 TaxID=2782675 RepID=UPI001FFAFD76|nr:XRE family transcriptional regulator [Bradyrhizobium sp. 44]MCK1283439.1 ImmA/IrrE family metallo-endopeptidase [Bradyrhizobium sp. 44]